MTDAEPLPPARTDHGALRRAPGGGMKVASLEILEHRIPFRFSFRHALAERSEGHGILVHSRDEAGNEGYGECVPRSYVTGETPDSVKEVLRTRLLPPLMALEFRSFSEVEAWLHRQLDELPRDHHAAFCAMELALLDLAGHHFGVSAGEVVGPVRHREIAYSGVISADGEEAVMQATAAIAAVGPPRVKVKVGLDPESDRRILEGVRARLGPDVGLRIDANCAWTAEEALRNIESFLRFDLESIEQPLPGIDLEGLAWLTARSPTPIIVDESLASLRDARQLIDRRACHHFNIRISKCGGLINATRLRDLAEAAGMGCQLGAQVGETSLLSAAGRHFGTRSKNVLFFEGSYGTLLLEEDITTPDLTIGVGGLAPAIEGTGLGVPVDEERLARFVVDRLRLEGA